MEENEISSTSEGRVLHVFSNSLSRHRMSFYADLPSSESHLEKKRIIDIRKLLQKVLNYSKPKYRSKRIKKPRSMWEHTSFDKYSTNITCPNCLYCIKTNVKHYNTCVTHLIATTLLPVCMCSLPYYSIHFKDTIHSCPRCEIYLGVKFSENKFPYMILCNKKK